MAGRGQAVFIQAGGLALVLGSREKLATDGALADSSSDGYGGIVLAQNVRYATEVD